MGITVEWYDEHETVIYWQFVGHWTLQDYTEAVHTSITLADGQMKEVLVDLTHAGPPPSGIISHIIALYCGPKPYSERVVILGAGPIYASLLRVVQALPGMHARLILHDDRNQRKRNGQHHGPMIC
jgi:hypothetical protein